MSEGGTMIAKFRRAFGKPRCACGHYRRKHPNGGACVVAGCGCVKYNPK